ncbi:Reverse transcriptase domain [Trinorchestia longiramus]|nr:Reverse transcriptase domain [Trinorchestia longiramus]
MREDPGSRSAAAVQRPPLRTTIIAIDFSKAFDTVPHPEFISSLPLNRHIIRWLVCYLKGRSAKCSNHDNLSSSRSALAGIPHGSVISPALFNQFVSDYPSTAPLITSYTDDFTAIATTPKFLILPPSSPPTLLTSPHEPNKRASQFQ